MNTMKALFLPKSKQFFFDLKEKTGEASTLLLSWAPVIMAEYASYYIILLNISKYPWKCLNKPL